MSKLNYQSYLAVIEEQDINDINPKQHLLFGVYEHKDDYSLLHAIRFRMSQVKDEILSYTEYKFTNEIYKLLNYRVITEEEIKENHIDIIYPDVSSHDLRQAQVERYSKEIGKQISDSFGHLMPFFILTYGKIPNGFYCTFESEYDDSDYSMSFDDLRVYYNNEQGISYKDTTNIYVWCDNWGESVNILRAMRNIVSDEVSSADYHYLLGNRDISFTYTSQQIANFTKQVEKLKSMDLNTLIKSSDDASFEADNSKTYDEWLENNSDLYLEFDEDTTNMFKE